MELIEVLAEDLSASKGEEISAEEFVSTYADVEAYTSCDDEGDDLHECDFFGQYLGPTKWLHLTPAAHESVDQIHFDIWKEVWKNPHGMVDVAEKVSQETLRYYKEFMLEPRTPMNDAEASTKPLVRVKVVPASFGQEGFEEAVWEATEDLLVQSDTKGEASSTKRCKAITFVVAAPDLMDPTLMEKGGRAYRSAQAEFDMDGFRAFTSTLMEKLVMFSKIEGIPLDDKIQLTPFHPMWRECVGEGSGAELEGRQAVCKPFPYPTVAISTEIDV